MEDLKKQNEELLMVLRQITDAANAAALPSVPPSHWDEWALSKAREFVKRTEEVNHPRALLVSAIQCLLVDAMEYATDKAPAAGAGGQAANHEAAAELFERSAADCARQFGTTDTSTGLLYFKDADHEEIYDELMEKAAKHRALAQQGRAPATNAGGVACEHCAMRRPLHDTDCPVAVAGLSASQQPCGYVLKTGHGNRFAETLDHVPAEARHMWVAVYYKAPAADAGGVEGDFANRSRASNACAAPAKREASTLQENFLTDLKTLTEKLHDNWGDCLWLDASELVALEKAIDAIDANTTPLK